MMSIIGNLTLCAALLLPFGTSAGEIEQSPTKRVGYEMEAHALACDLHNQATEFTGPSGESLDSEPKRRLAAANQCVDDALSQIQPQYKAAFSVSGDSAPKLEELYAAWILWMEALRSYLPDARKEQLQHAFETKFAALKADVDRR